MKTLGTSQTYTNDLLTSTGTLYTGTVKESFPKKDEINFMTKETLKEVDSKWTVNQAQEFALSKFKNKSSFKKGIVIWESILDVLKIGVLTGHKFGVKWQAEQDKNFYNKEDLWESYKASNTIFEDEIALRQEFEKWFEKKLKRNKI